MKRSVCGLLFSALGVAVMSGAAPRAAGQSAVTASSIHSSPYQPQYACDGRGDTRWASKSYAGRPEWLQIDLGRRVPVRDVLVHWEAAHAVEYEIQVSDDAKQWTTIGRKTGGAGGKELLTDMDGQGRYVRILCLKPGQFKLFSIWEVEFPDAETAQAMKEARQAAEALRRATEIEKRKALAGQFQKLGVDEIVFAVRQPGVDGHWYANFAYYAFDTNLKCYRAGGRLCKLDVKTGEVTVLIDDPEGSVRDPVVHYDARKVLFSWRKAGTEHFHLYEIGVDGSNIRQLTDGDCDDIEPCYLPDGDIVFVSSRCHRWVQCWVTQVAVLYRCGPDGKNVRQISANCEHDNTPWVLPDGRIIYQRWEYVDRSQVHYHHLWSANPDGTGQMIYFGNLQPGSVFIDAKPIPGTTDVIAINSPGHGRREHEGHVAILSQKGGPDDQTALRNISAGNCRDPYALSQDAFLAARGKEMVVMDPSGRTLVVHSLPPEYGDAQLHEPRPIVKRKRERVIPPRITPQRPTGRLILADAYVGRNMTGVERGDIKKLLVVESLPKPINFTGGMDPLSYGGTFTLERVVGTVPVEEDGSAYIELPAMRSFFFVALDENNMSVKRMQSFLTVQPGETTSCVGCHEQRTNTPLPSMNLQALLRAPSRIEPIEHVPEVFDFPRDVQPILDRHCVRCHDYDRPADAQGPDDGPRAGGIILTGDHGPMFSHSYFTLTYHRQFVDGRNDPKSNLPPRSIGTSASPLMKKIDGSHYGAKLSPREADVIRYWIESGAPYPGTYAALGNGSIGGYHQNRQIETDYQWPATKAAGEAIQRRCGSCHQGKTVLPRSLSDEIGLSFWRPNWNDPRLKHSRHIMFNLSRPEKSLILLAPLSKRAGGFDVCRAEANDPRAPAIFVDTNDPDYRKILAMCVAGKERLDQIQRFDMPHFRPPAQYLREMKRYGILSEIPAEDEKVDPYALDRQYWQSLWYGPPR